MNLATVIAIVVLLLVVSLALRYIIREKKRGVKCVGCPNAGSCTKYGETHTAAQNCGKKH